MRAALAARGGAAVPNNFQQTAPGPSGRGAGGRMPAAAARNPQTEAFLDMLGLPYNLDADGQPGLGNGAVAGHGWGPPEPASAGAPACPPCVAGLLRALPDTLHFCPRQVPA